MKSIRSLLRSLLLFVTLLPAIATTVIPPTFDELVDQAEIIFQGTVVDVRSEWMGAGAQRHIVSYVTFRVDEAIKQQPGATYSLLMLGGTVNGETMGVADAPLFKVGDRDILFVEHNGTQFIPLVGIMHGRFRLRADADTGKEIVTTDAGEPVTNVADLGKNRAPIEFDSPHSATSASLKNALAAADFKNAIRMKLGIAGH